MTMLYVNVIISWPIHKLPDIHQQTDESTSSSCNHNSAEFCSKQQCIKPFCASAFRHVCPFNCRCCQASQLLAKATACRSAGATSAVRVLVKMMAAALASLPKSEFTAADDQGLAGFVSSLGLQPEVSIACH
jgi:hypothetical protein